ncbi:ephrin-B1-like [Uloborus diversus]|uniref:ephrin-B1-like n=1 Tax=Uloborus diversus TaxID=327109 RepID=UPI00240A4955|nr:ephrin-B1-like [Uloborus diversus]
MKFRIDNTDHIIDVNRGNLPFEYDQVNIICPAYKPGTKEEDVERYVIYNVSKEEYDSCRITNPNPRIIAVCDKPHHLRYFTITFRNFTPQPGGLEFTPGQDYYFISTSRNGSDGLHQRVGGRCATHNTKVIFKVCCGPSKSSTTEVPSSTTTTVSTTTTTTLPPSTPFHRFRRPTMPPFRLPPGINTSKYPNYKSYDFPREEESGKMPSKKTEDRDKLPNETRAKNEELKNQASFIKLQQNCILTVTTLLLTQYHHLLAR